MHSFVSSRLDYCNSLLHRVSDELLQKLQVIQKSERGRTSGDGSKDVRPYHPGASRTSLAARLPTHKVQAGDDGLQVSPWVGATVSG